MFEMKNDTPIYGLVHASEVDKGSFYIQIEEPWSRLSQRRRMWQKDIKDKWSEESATYKRRIESEWKTHGGMKLNGDWILKSEYDLAQRALDMVNTVSPEADSMIQGTPVTQPAQAADPVQAGWLAQWWMHGIIGIGTLALMASTFWWGFIKSSWSGV